jgi:hypothetical protein
LSLRPSATVVNPGVSSGRPPQTGPIDLTAAENRKQALDQTPVKAVSVPSRVASRIQNPKRQELARESISVNARAIREQQMVRRGELAKEQLIKALLITSEKLNAMQKKIQGDQERQPIS